MAKIKNNNLKWKAVKLEGTIDGDDLQGFAGLEVLENYDSSLLGGNKKRRRDFAVSDLDGDIITGSAKRSKADDENGNESEKEEEEVKVVKKKKKKILNNYPGKFVLLNPPQDDEDFFANEEHSSVRAVRQK